MKHFCPLVCCALVLCACESVQISQPYMAAERGWSASYAGRGQKFSTADFDLFVRTKNGKSISIDELKGEAFVVALYFDPRVAGLTIDPREILLILADRPALVPMRFDVKFAGYNGNRGDCGPYPSSRFPILQFGPGPRHSIGKGFCVDLYFATQPPLPNSEFELRISSVQKQEKQVPVPAVKFKKGSVTMWWTL